VDIRIIRINNVPQGTTPAEKLQDEYVVIKNLGTDSVRMAGWQLWDTTYTADGRISNLYRHKYVFPEFLSNGQAWRVDPGELVFLITGPGLDIYIPSIPSVQNPQFHFHWGKSQQVWNNAGDIACLLRPEGSQLMVVSVLPVSGIPNTSWARRW
jgi:hypothetical protein